MENLKLIILSTFLATSLVSAARAAQPTTCPSVDIVKKAGFMGIQEDKEDKLYAAYQLSKYSTTETWGFVIGVPFDQATTKGDAMNKAKEALKTLNGEPQPLPVDDKNKQWYCLYKNAYDYIAFTVTPISVSNEMVHSVVGVKNDSIKK